MTRIKLDDNYLKDYPASHRIELMFQHVRIMMNFLITVDDIFKRMTLKEELQEDLNYLRMIVDTQTVPTDRLPPQGASQQ